MMKKALLFIVLCVSLSSCSPFKKAEAIEDDELLPCEKAMISSEIEIPMSSNQVK